MSAHVLLNLLNELRKRENTRLVEHFISFTQRVYNNTGAGMLDFIYHMALKLLKIAFFDVKTSGFCHHLLLRNVMMNVITLRY